MRILLDECVHEALRHSFDGHDCQTCRYAGLRNLTNGHLLTAAEEAGFEVLVTVDQSMPYQQNLTGREIALLAMRPQSIDIADLEALMPDVLRALAKVQPGAVIRVSDPEQS